MQPESGIPIAPDFLTEDARDEWDYYTEILDNCGIITLADRGSLVALASNIADYNKIRKILDATPMLVLGTEEDPETGEVVQVAVVNKTWSKLNAALRDKEISMKSWASEFGLTPAARTRIQTPANNTKVDTSAKERYFA